MATLLMLSPAPVLEAPGDELVLDARFVAGMELHCQLWPGRVISVLRRGAGGIPDGLRYTRARLPFEVVLLDQDEALPELLLDSATLVYCALDDMRFLPLAAEMRRRVGRLVYTVEQSLSERLGLARDSGRSLRRRLSALIWSLRNESAFRSALRAADGVHLNGAAAAAAYGRLNPRTLCYLDNRIRMPLLARAQDREARAERLKAGEPLALYALGPLTEAAGVMDLLQVASALSLRGMAFSLTILGHGPLAARLQAGIGEMKLGQTVRLELPGALEGALLPRLRTRADLLLMPARQPEGPGTQIEAMGCGVPVLGYATPGWRLLAAASGGGWAVPARPGRMVAEIVQLNRNRARLVTASERAHAFAETTTFERVFARRMAHLREVAGLEA